MVHALKVLFSLNPLKWHQTEMHDDEDRHDWRAVNYTPSLSIAKQCIVGLSAFTAGYKPSLVMEILSNGGDGLENLPPSLSTGWYFSPLSHSYQLFPPRNDNGLCVLSRVLGICEGGVVGFHFPLATLYEARDRTNEHCFSVCSCSGAHKLTLFIDPALHCAPIYRKLFPFSSFSPKQMMRERM